MTQQPSVFVPSDNANYDAWIKAWGAFLTLQISSEDPERKTIHEDFNVFFGTFNASKFKYLTEQYGIRTPARLVSYPLLNRMVNFLVNEVRNESLDVGVECIDETVINEQLDKRARAAAEVLLRPMRRQLEKEIKTKMPDDMTDMPIPDSPEEFMNMDWKAEEEVAMQWALRYMNLTYSLDSLFQDGMRDLVLSYREIYDIGPGDKDPSVRRVDPRNIRYAKTTSSWIQDSPWIVEETLEPITDVLHEFRGEIERSPELHQVLDSLATGKQDALTKYHANGWVHTDSTGHLVRVVRYRWRAIRPLTYKFSENKYQPNIPFVKKVHPTEVGQNIKTFPIEDVYVGVCICGYHISQGRKYNQVRKAGNYARATHGYVGCVRDTPSLTQMIKHLLVFYFIVMYHIEATLNRAGGKAVVYDVAQKPGNVPINDVFFHAKEGGMILINSAQTGMNLLNRASFNQFQSVDFTLSSSITQLINLKMMIESTAERFIGMNDSVLGVAKTEEAVGLNESKVRQSGLITQNLYDDHYQVLDAVMTEVIGQLRYHWPHDKKRTLRLFGERGLQLFDFNGKALQYEYGLFIRNNQKERQLKARLQNAAEKSYVAGQMELEDWLKIMNANNSREMERSLKEGIRTIKQLSEMKQQGDMALAKEKNELTRLSIQSRIEAARIEAQAYVETQKMKMAMDKEGNIRDNMIKVNQVAEESRSALAGPSAIMDQPFPNEEPQQPTGEEMMPQM